jgi:hypothetical protein
MPTQKKFWTKVVLKILKAELAKRDFTYSELKDKLEKIGVKESEANIKNKLSRGTFSAIFFLKCLRAMEVQTLFFDDAIFFKQELKD